MPTPMLHQSTPDYLKVRGPLPALGTLTPPPPKCQNCGGLGYIPVTTPIHAPAAGWAPCRVCRVVLRDHFEAPKQVPASDRTVTTKHNGAPEAAPANLSLPDDDAKRQEYPMADGLLDYFPNALAEVSRVSKIGNDQHNPGEAMHWARDKSTDHANKIMRHLVDRGRFDGRGVRHTARLAWRALAMLQTELEQEEGLPQSRASLGQAPQQAETVH